MNKQITIYPLGGNNQPIFPPQEEQDNVTSIILRLDEITLQMDGSRIVHGYLHRETGLIRFPATGAKCNEDCGEYARIGFLFRTDKTGTHYNCTELQDNRISEAAKQRLEETVLKLQERYGHESLHEVPPKG